MRILAAAERLFSEHGFDATSTSRIAELAAVPKGLTFHYFPTKPDLLRALVREHAGIGPIDTSALIEPRDTVRSLLNLTGKLFQIQATSEVLRVILWREQRTHPEVKSRLIEHRNQVQVVIEQVLRGSLPKPVPAARLSTAAKAWLAILSSPPSVGGAPADPADNDTQDESARVEFNSAATEFHAFAELICEG